jgi:phosphoribosylformimino-5-aminoimidazole carboxamide ribotide isomerase
MPFRVLPVLDLKKGQVVHAKGGRRDRYVAVRSVLCDRPDPILMARSMRDVLGSSTLYLADLDAIEGCAAPCIGIYHAIASLGLELWVDAGLREARSAGPFLELDAGKLQIVVGLETVRGPRELGQIVRLVGADRTIFSLDMFDRLPRIADGQAWSTSQPRELAHRAIEQGVNHLLILDLARVGTGRGTGSDDLLAQLTESHPDIELSVGGGVSGIEDLRRLRDAGVAAALVASAIHDGRIGRRDIEPISGHAKQEPAGRAGGAQNPE